MTPFYDVTKTYEENYENGPFGLFADPSYVVRYTKSPSSFMGFSVNFPFGIPAGPLLNSRFMIAAWRAGFCINTYKTVRSDVYPCHPFPNVIQVKGSSFDIHPHETVLGELSMDQFDVTHDGVTNSFGVPSKPPEVWQNDVQIALDHMPAGNLCILSFMGLKKETMSRDEYIQDFVRAYAMAQETNAQIFEVNLSCPNFGAEGLICHDMTMSHDVLEALHGQKKNTPLLVKIGYFPPEKQDDLEKILDMIQHFADGVVAINTIPAKVVDKQGRQVLPGSSVRLVSGVCGAAIRWAGLETAERIVFLKQKHNWKHLIVVGVGGVVSPDDYFAYMKRGVDAVQSAVGAMWRPTLAEEIIQKL
ncbi:MAG: diguanylate cyclase [Patescibacteria group bacterium]|nr:diguanylate cyclase [Patescibacteria group bacterium]